MAFPAASTAGRRSSVSGFVSPTAMRYSPGCRFHNGSLDQIADHFVGLPLGTGTRVLDVNAVVLRHDVALRVEQMHEVFRVDAGRAAARASAATVISQLPRRLTSAARSSIASPKRVRGSSLTTMIHAPVALGTIDNAMRQFDRTQHRARRPARSIVNDTVRSARRCCGVS